MGSRAVTPFNFFLSILPITQLIVMFRVYFVYTDDITKPFIAGAVIWGLFLVLPLKTNLGIRRMQNGMEDGGTKGRRCVAVISFSVLFTASTSYVV